MSRKEVKLTEIFEIIRLKIWTVDGGWRVGVGEIWGAWNNMGGDYRSVAMWGALHFNRKRGRIFQVSGELNRLRSFWVILAHFGVKSTPISSNSNYC